MQTFTPQPHQPRAFVQVMIIFDGELGQRVDRACEKFKMSRPKMILQMVKFALDHLENHKS